VSLESARSLQFDTVKPANKLAGAPAAGEVTCAACGCLIAQEYYDVNEQVVCGRCRGELARQAEVPKGAGVFGKAALFGLGAAIAGAILYYAVIAIANLEIGIVAIAIGYMVGFAVRKAADNRGGLRFQILAIVLTYWAVGLAYTPLVFAGSKEGDTQEVAASPVAGEAVALEKDAPAAAGFVFAVGVLFAFTFALPVLVVAGSLPGGLISAAIIAFGMQQAWRMAGAPRLMITGPYRVVRAAAS
jgi:hypothetical protein